MSMIVCIIASIFLCFATVISSQQDDQNVFTVNIYYEENVRYQKNKSHALHQTLSENTPECNLDPFIRETIRNYQPVVNQIFDSVINGSNKGKVYEELSFFVDRFGSRISGTQNLENALTYVQNLMHDVYQLDNVHGETVVVPNWVRGNESAVMLKPRIYKIGVLGLGGSVGTPKDGITARVLVVDSFDELHRKSDWAKGKIVVYNQKWVSYGKSVKYRSHGASEAAKVGAVASLIRSVTPKSLYTLHTGWQDYEENVNKIPTASITVEDADMLQRMSDRGENIVISLYMEAELKPSTTSRNIVAEYTGKVKKDEIVLLSGHLDSWDVGQGAMDDGAGAFVSWYSLEVLKSLGLRPNRTLRAVLWTAEEEGLIGAQQYVQAHKHELDKFNLVMESDEGTFTPEGIEFSGSNSAACIMREIAQLMGPLNATSFKVGSGISSDIILFQALDIPAADLINKNDKYFWYHHTNADTMTVIDSDDLDRNVAMFAAIAYVAADLPLRLPRNNSENYV